MSAPADWQWDIAGVTLGDGTVYGIVASAGLHGAEEIRSSDDPRPQAHGVFLGRDYLGARLVSLEVAITADDAAAARAAVEELAAAWHMTGPAEGETEPLRFRLPGRPAQRLMGRPRRAAFDTSRLQAGRVRAELEYFAADPYIYADEAESVALPLTAESVGRTYPRTYPLTYGAALSGVAIVTNSGTVPTHPTIRIVGPVDNPQVENVTAGEYVRIALSLTADDYLDVDMASGTVMLNGTASRRSALTSESTWWALAPGDNEVRARADTVQTGAVAAVSWRSAWI